MSIVEREYALTSDEKSSWEENGYILRYDVFTKNENDILRRIADEIAEGKRPFPSTNINQNALVRDGKIDETGIHAMHKIHHVSCYCPDFLTRVRDLIFSVSTIYIFGKPRRLD